MTDNESAAFSAANSKLILIIDDDNNLRAVLTMCLTMAGFQVVTAVDGHDARATLEVRDPHLIVSDLMMPRQGGYDFLRNLRGAGGRPIPIFIMTGNSLDASTIAMMMHESGAVEFFKKPIQTPVFLAAVRRVLNTTPQS